MDTLVSHALKSGPTVNLLSSPLMSQGTTGIQANTYPPIKLNKLITKEVPVNKNTLNNVMTAAHSLKMKSDENIDNSLNMDQKTIDKNNKNHDLDKNIGSIHD